MWGTETNNDRNQYANRGYFGGGGGGGADNSPAGPYGRGGGGAGADPPGAGGPGLGGEGGDGGNGRGHGNESGSLQGDIGAQPAPDNGCNSSQGQPGETGGAGGEWALKGAASNNTGDGGAAGRAIAGTSYSVIGSISATTIKGDYPATP